jgi:hypothetical protein
MLEQSSLAKNFLRLAAASIMSYIYYSSIFVFIYDYWSVYKKEEVFKKNLSKTVKKCYKLMKKLIFRV